MTRHDPERLDRASYPSTEVRIPVLYGDLDPNGHVNNVMMGRFFEQARVLAHTDFNFRADDGERLRFLVARVSIDYLAEGRFGTDLVVKTRLAGAGTSSLHLQQAGWQDEVCVSLCDTTIVRIRDGRPTPLPGHLRDRANATT